MVSIHSVPGHLHVQGGALLLLHRHALLLLHRVAPALQHRHAHLLALQIFSNNNKYFRVCTDLYGVAVCGDGVGADLLVHGPAAVPGGGGGGGQVLGQGGGGGHAHQHQDSHQLGIGGEGCIYQVPLSAYLLTVGLVACMVASGQVLGCSH